MAAEETKQSEIDTVIMSDMKQLLKKIGVTASDAVLEVGKELAAMNFKNNDEKTKWLNEKKIIFTNDSDSPQDSSTSSLSAAYSLAQYDGYYPLTVDGKSNPAAYVQIQTIAHNSQLVINGTKQGVRYYSVSVSISTDGVTVNTYPFSNSSDQVTFVDNVLKIEDISATLTFSRQSAEYDMIYTFIGAASGKVGDLNVSGSNSLNATGLSQFLGHYYSNSDDIKTTLDITSIFEVSLNGQSSNSFIYIPSMFVLIVHNLGFSTFLGTSGKNGKAAYMMVNDKTPFLLNTLPDP